MQNGLRNTISHMSISIVFAGFINSPSFMIRLMLNKKIMLCIISNATCNYYSENFHQVIQLAPYRRNTGLENLSFKVY